MKTLPKSLIAGLQRRFSPAYRTLCREAEMASTCCQGGRTAFQQALKVLPAALLLLLSSCHVPKEETAATYRNPIIYADVPDMSVCRADSNYYMVSTTMHLMPGAPIMRSTDLQHWQTIGYVFDALDDGLRYHLLGDSTAYGQGQWASSLRYHDGRFYVWFTANGAPHRGFIYTATDPAGPWTLLARPPHYHDASLFFDDDGRVYLFHSTGRLTELRPDLTDRLADGLDLQLFERDADEQGLLEGSAAFKRNGWYYLMMISWPYDRGGIRREVCYRSRTITGPYEKRVILETPFDGYGGVGQGCLVDSPSGQWHALIFQDREGVGRVPCLLPCRWTDDDWPMLGDAEGHVPNDASLPYISTSGICGSDDFSEPALSLVWQWNHHPIDSAWSLTDRPGFLRLTTARIVPNLYLAPNTLTQRMPGPSCQGQACLHLAGLQPGDVAGLAALNGDSGVLAVEQQADGSRRLVLTEQKAAFSEPQHGIDHVDVEEIWSVSLAQDSVYLCIDANFGPDTDLASYSYSLDGQTWQVVGRPIRMTYDYRRLFMGTRFALFCYATQILGGYVDIDCFRLNTFGQEQP